MTYSSTMYMYFDTYIHSSRYVKHWQSITNNQKAAQLVVSHKGHTFKNKITPQQNQKKKKKRIYLPGISSCKLPM